MAIKILGSSWSTEEKSPPYGQLCAMNLILMKLNMHVVSVWNWRWSVTVYSWKGKRKKRCFLSWRKCEWAAFLTRTIVSVVWLHHSNTGS